MRSSCQPLSLLSLAIVLTVALSPFSAASESQRTLLESDLGLSKVLFKRSSAQQACTVGTCVGPVAEVFSNSDCTGTSTLIQMFNLGSGECESMLTFSRNFTCSRVGYVDQTFSSGTTCAREDFMLNARLKIAQCIQKPAEGGGTISEAYFCAASDSSQGVDAQVIEPPIGPISTSVPVAGPLPICNAQNGCGSDYATIYVYDQSDTNCTGTPTAARVIASTKLATCERNAEDAVEPTFTTCDSITKRLTTSVYTKSCSDLNSFVGDRYEPVDTCHLAIASSSFERRIISCPTQVSTPSGSGSPSGSPSASPSSPSASPSSPSGTPSSPSGTPSSPSGTPSSPSGTPSSSSGPSSSASSSKFGSSSLSMPLLALVLASLVAFANFA